MICCRVSLARCLFRAMNTHTLLLFLLLVTLSGCIVTYRDFPIPNPLPNPYEPAATSRCRQTIQFPGGPERESTNETRFTGVGSRLHVEATLQDALNLYGGCHSTLPVVEGAQPAEAEVVVDVLEKPHPWYSLVLEVTSRELFGIIPVYSGQGGWELSYSLYDRHELQKTYTYAITQRRYFWLLLLPFSWINFFTYSLDEALRVTTAQFVVDAQRDGYL